MVANNSNVPLTLGLNNYTGGEVTLGADNETLTLQPGTYLIGYSGNITNTTGNSGLAFYDNGTQIPSTLAEQTVGATSDTANLANSHILSVTNPTTLTLRNTGAAAETITNLNATITKLA